jgi:hypothetical protein
MNTLTAEQLNHLAALAIEQVMQYSQNPLVENGQWISENRVQQEISELFKSYLATVVPTLPVPQYDPNAMATFGSF